MYRLWPFPNIFTHIFQRKRLYELFLYFTAYTCHESWEEEGTWYTTVSKKKSDTPLALGQTGQTATLCFSMRWVDTTAKLSGRGVSSNRHEQQEQELWLSRPASTCQREATDQWTYKLASQGIIILLVLFSPSPSSILRLYNTKTRLATESRRAIRILC